MKKLFFKNNNVYKSYIIGQIIFISVIFYLVKSRGLSSNYAFSFFIIYLVLFYLAILYGYLKHNKSIKSALLYGFIELLIMFPLVVVVLPYQCGKCYDLFFDYIYLFSNLLLLCFEFGISIGYLKLVGYIRQKKLKKIMYIFPPILVMSLLIFKLCFK